MAVVGHGVLHLAHHVDDDAFSHGDSAGIGIQVGRVVELGGGANFRAASSPEIDFGVRVVKVSEWAPPASRIRNFRRSRRAIYSFLSQFMLRHGRVHKDKTQ